MKYPTLALSGVALALLVACGGSDNASSTYTVIPTAADSLEAESKNNSKAGAIPVAVGQSLQSNIYPAGDIDYFAVNVEQGETYEFFVDQICTDCDSYLYLEDSQGRLLAENDDYLVLDSGIVFEATEDSTIFLKVTAFNHLYEVLSYRVGAYKYVDADNDDFSPRLDCNDNNIEISPLAPETKHNSIDENCDGVAQLDPKNLNFNEPDNTFEQAVFQRPDVYQIVASNGAAHADGYGVLTAGDTDFRKLFIPAGFSGDVSTYVDSGVEVSYYNQRSELVDQDVILGGEYSKNRWLYIKLHNFTDQTVDYGVAFKLFGADADDDGFNAAPTIYNFDCNDDNPKIHPNAEEINDDGIDSNCDGQDNEVALKPTVNRSSKVK